jgi:S1-C subfamily serine protease
MRISTMLGLAIVAIPSLLPAQDMVRPAGERQISVGIGISCRECRLAFPEYRFAIPPMISEVQEGSIGAKAGLMAGDTLVAIEGESITSDVGAGYFGARVPGRDQKWTVRRDGKEVTVTLVIPPDA